MQAMLNRILQDGPCLDGVAAASAPHHAPTAAADIEDMGNQARSLLKASCAPSGGSTGDRQACGNLQSSQQTLTSSDSGSNSRCQHTLWGVQGPRPSSSAEPAAIQVLGRQTGRLELEWLRLMPMEAARTYLMSIRGTQHQAPVNTTPRQACLTPLL